MFPHLTLNGHEETYWRSAAARGKVRFMNDVFKTMRVHEFFYLNEQGMGSRIQDFDALSKLYPFSSFLKELEAMLDYVSKDANASGAKMLRAFSYVYLFACLHFYQGLLLGSQTAGRVYIKKFEKASRPTFLSRLFGISPPENIAAKYATLKKEAPFIEQALPMAAFILQRCGNYDLYAGVIKSEANSLDDTLSRLGTNLPSNLFRLFDFMDRTPVA